jgi:murein DD-endopeptidase MepM/ murein hydrolase activator NlpD
MFIPAVVSVALAIIYSTLAKQYRAYTQSGLLPPGPSNVQRADDQVRSASIVDAQPGPIQARQASFHLQASTAHVVTSPLYNLAALRVRHYGSVLPAATTQHRASGQAFVVDHPVTKSRAITAEQAAVASYRDRLEGQMEALAPARHRQQVKQYLEAAAAAQATKEREARQALAAARHRQQVERFLVAAAAASRAKLASVPAVSHATVPPPPVTRTVFHTGVVTPPAQSPPPPVGGVPGKGGLPLPVQYLQNGSVDQGVDYAAPGGTPLLAMGPGRIVKAGIPGFGPNAPVLQIAGGPLAGRAVYYGHAGPNVVPVGAPVAQGQQISIVGYGRVGISSGPHLEVGFYPPGPNGAGQAMLNHINSAVGHNTGR